jgi:hypothetical protein
LAAKSRIYLDCWHAAVEVTDLGSCEETLASCSAALQDYEVESDGEEEEDAAEEEPEEEEEGEECEEGEEGEECEESSTDLDEFVD